MASSALRLTLLVLVATATTACARHTGVRTIGIQPPPGPASVRCERFSSGPGKEASRIAAWYRRGWRVAYAVRRDTTHWWLFGIGYSDEVVCFARAVDPSVVSAPASVAEPPADTGATADEPAPAPAAAP